MPAKTDQLRFTAPCELTAAADGKPPAINIIANSGDVMRPGGWGSTVLNLSALTLPPQVTLLADHDSSLSGIIGSGKASIVAGKLLVAGHLALVNDVAKQIVELHKAGVSFQASVGVDPSKITRLQAGEKATVNGREFTAGPQGLSIVHAGLLREVTITALGADAATSVSIAANKGTTNMPDTTTTADRAEILKAERERVAAIDAACSGLVDRVDQTRVADLRAKAMREEITVEALQAAVLDLLRASRPAGPGIHVASGQSGDAASIEAALLCRAGFAHVAEKKLGPQVMDGAKRILNASFADLLKLSLASEGKTIPVERNELIRAGFSTGSAPVALGNVMNKILEQAYLEAASPWRLFCAVRPAANFKPHVGVRPSFLGDFTQLPPDGNIAHATFGESTFPWSVDTYAKQLRVSRKQVIDDDLGIFSEVAPSFSKMSARKINDLVISTLMANPSNFFHSNNGNLLSDPGGALSIESLGLAMLAMRQQRDSEGNDLDISPAVLLVPPDLEVTAKSVLESEYIQRAAESSGPTGNPVKSALAMAVDSRLSNTSKFDTASALKWFLFAGPASVPMIVGFLDGRQTPAVEFFGLESDPDNLGVSWRAYIDVGVAMGDPRAAVRSDGVAAEE